MRLWDGRIGRWLTTDPKGQYSSPYLGMGNNPISLTDPDGGSADWHWDGNDLVADEGDNIYTLMSFLGISEIDARGLMASFGVFTNENDVLQLQENQRFNLVGIGSFFYNKNEEIFDFQSFKHPPKISEPKGIWRKFETEISVSKKNKIEDIIIKKGVPYVGSKLLEKVVGVGGLLSSWDSNLGEKNQLNILQGRHPDYPNKIWAIDSVFISDEQLKIERQQYLDSLRVHYPNGLSPVDSLLLGIK